MRLSKASWEVSMNAITNCDNNLTLCCNFNNDFKPYHVSALKAIKTHSSEICIVFTLEL